MYSTIDNSAYTQSHNVCSIYRILTLENYSELEVSTFARSDDDDTRACFVESE